jgi:hypothetical protein
MPHLDGTGPEGKGESTGRKLGRCIPAKEELIISKLGKGMGLKRKSGGGSGQQKRLKSGDKL